MLVHLLRYDSESFHFCGHSLEIWHELALCLNEAHIDVATTLEGGLHNCKVLGDGAHLVLYAKDSGTQTSIIVLSVVGSSISSPW